MLARKMYSFPRAAVTHYHKLGGLKTTEIFSLRFGVWKSEIKVSTRLVPSEGESVSCFW